LTALGLSELQTFYFLEFVGEGSLGFIEAAKKREEGEDRPSSPRFLGSADQMPQEFTQLLVQLHTRNSWTCWRSLLQPLLAGL
jgi:hypothetical protein